MGGVREGFELIFVTIFAGFAANVHGLIGRSASRLGIIAGAKRLRTSVRSEPQDHAQYRPTDEQHFDRLVQFQMRPPYRVGTTYQTLQKMAGLE